MVARGGFVVDIRWENGKIAEVTIESKLGGNLRLRSLNQLIDVDGATLIGAKGDNPNQFYPVNSVKEPLISKKAKLKKLKLAKTYLYDIPTEAGKFYSFKLKQ